MARTGHMNVDGLEELQRNLEKFTNNNLDAFIDSCAKELAARLLAKVVKRTPVGDYPSGSGKVGGTLRRGWTGNKSTGASAYAQSLKINHYADATVIEIVNPIEYASYVEFGHRTRNHSGWVKGKFMLTISAQEIQSAAPGIIERKLKKELGEIFS